MLSRISGFLIAFLLASAPLPAAAEWHEQAVEWSLDGETFSGVLVYNGSSSKPRPGLLMVPNWMGVNASAVERAREIAGERYVVLVADVYGKDVRPANAQEAGAQARKMYADRQTLRARAAKALDVLRSNEAGAPLDARRLGALGFCFGGTTVLEMARAGADVAGVVSLHGGLGTDLPAEDTPAASILVLNGAADAAVTAEEIAGFQQEMDTVQADWQFVNYAGAVHCFAEASAASPPNCVYHPVAAKRARTALHAFFEDVMAADQ